MKKLEVNDNCIGCGACVAIDPEHFDFNDEGLSTSISNDNLDSSELANAINSCPVGAISCNCNCDENCNCGDDCSCGDDCCCHNK